jgi:hypothetical protein
VKVEDTTLSGRDRLSELLVLLRSSKVSKSYVNRFVFPSWWDDAILDEDAGFDLAVGYLSRRLGLSMDALYQGRIEWLMMPSRYKKNKGVDAVDLKVPTAIATSVGRSVLECVGRPYSPIPPAEEVRAKLLEGNAKWVTLERVLGYLWDRGIPVLSLAESTSGVGKRPRAMVASVLNRPVLLLFVAHKYESLFLHDIAHEMGHVFHGHVTGNEVLVDYDSDMAGGVESAEEQAANAFAWAVLGGQWPGPKGTFHKAQTLKEFSEAQSWRRISPGVVAQQAVYRSAISRRSLASETCNLVGDAIDGLALIARVATERLDFEHVSEDTQDYVRRMCGLGEHGAVSDR